MKSLLFQPGAVFEEPPPCGPKRVELVRTYRKDNRLYHLVIRDKIVVEDPYLMLVKAVAFATRTGEPMMAVPPPRKIRDFLIKNDA